jgi:ribosomal protein S18 acetylase RimI-like enzyme
MTTMTGLTVREAALADAEDVVRINVRAWQQAYAGIVPDDVLAALPARVPERVRRVRERWSAPGPRRWRTVVAVEPDTPPVGFATFGPYRVNGHDDTELDPTVGEVLAIYVDPPRQGRGAGRALMDAAVGALRERDGVTELRLWVLADNVPARAFYERYGCVADGATHFFRVQRPDGTPVDLPEVRYALRW